MPSPHISKVNRAIAQSNIEKKIVYLQFLQKQIQSGSVGSDIFSTIPRSLRSFNAWSSANKETSFSANAAETLRSNPALTELVLALLKAIDVERKRGYGNTKTVRAETMLRREMEVLRKQLRSIETQYAVNKLELSKKDSKYESLFVQKSNLENEFSLIRKKFETRIQELEIENKNLLKSLAKVTLVHK